MAKSKLRKIFGEKKIVLKRSKPKEKPSGTSLHSVISNSYAKKSKQAKGLEKDGYVYDHELSNHNQQVYYNPEKKKLITSVAGTHNWSDVGTDIYLAAGKLKKTNRYKEAHSTLRKAKAKYNPSESSVVGHSLGGAIASRIGQKEDKIITYNKGATIGEKKRKNETHIHTTGDIVSTFAPKDKVINYKGFNPLSAHNTDRLKGGSFVV